jgi:hypothetical protein
MHGLNMRMEVCQFILYRFKFLPWLLPRSAPLFFDLLHHFIFHSPPSQY